MFRRSREKLEAESFAQVRFCLEENVLIQARHLPVLISEHIVIQFVHEDRFLRASFEEDVAHHVRDELVVLVFGNFLLFPSTNFLKELSAGAVAQHALNTA